MASHESVRADAVAESASIGLDALPDNCLHRALSLLPLDTLCACAAVSKHLKALVDDAHLWKSVDFSVGSWWVAQCRAKVTDATLRCIATKARGRMTSLIVTGSLVSPAAVVHAARLNPDLARTAPRCLDPLPCPIRSVTCFPCAQGSLHDRPGRALSTLLPERLWTLSFFLLQELSAFFEMRPVQIEVLAELAADWDPAQAAVLLDTCKGLRELRIGVATCGLHPVLPRLLAPPCSLVSLKIHGPGRTLAAAALSVDGAQRLGDFGARALAGPLRNAPALRSVSLDGNGIAEEGIRALVWALESAAPPPPPLALSLASNCVGPTGLRCLLRPIALGWLVLSSLELAGNQLGDGGAELLAEALSGSLAPSLRALGLADNRISASGAASLTTALRVGRSVESLDLSRNVLRADGAAALARLLHAQRRRHSSSGMDPASQAEHGRVVHLFLAECELGAEGADALARGLASARHLQTLHLQVREQRGTRSRSALLCLSANRASPAARLKNGP